MSELYTVEVVALEALHANSSSPLVFAALHRMAQIGRLKNIAGLKKDPTGWLEDLINALAAQPANKAKKALPPNAKLLPLHMAMKQLILHLAHPSEFPTPAAMMAELHVRSIHPDAGMPDHRNPWHKLDSFVLRLLADASAENEIRARYPNLDQNNLRVRSDDLWDFKLAKPKKAPPLSPMPGQFFESTLTVITDGAVLAHLQLGLRWSSTAFEG